MNRHLPPAFVLCFALAASGLAAEKKSKPASGKPSTVPSKSPMIVIPPPDAVVTDSAPRKLISSEMSGRDLQFFTTAVEAGRLQAYFVDLLKTSGDSAQIKALGEALSVTQQEENKQIARLASLKGWTVSIAPTGAQIKAGEELSKLSGSHFDKAVMDKILAASQEVAKAYEAAGQSTDADIQIFARQMLPLARERQQIIEKMTGAGSKAAGQLFRTNPTPKIPAPAAKPTPSATPQVNPAALVKPVATPPGPVGPTIVLPAITRPGS